MVDIRPILKHILIPLFLSRIEAHQTEGLYCQRGRHSVAIYVLRVIILMSLYTKPQNILQAK